MNCQIFENHVNDLARGRLMEAAPREGAAAHAEECARCAARLADERALAGGLTALAAGAKTREAPARVETALLAAFRARAGAGADASHTSAAAARTAPPNSSAVVIEPVVRQWSLRRTFTTAAAAAAAAVLLITLLPAASRLTRALRTPRERAATPGSRPEAAAPSARTEVARTGGVSGDAPTVGGDEEVTTPAEIRAPRTTVPARMTRATYSPAAGRAGGETVRRAAAAGAGGAGAAEAAGRGEVVTEFIPLMNGGKLAPEDAGQVVRVELPRSALASMGLPVDAERAHERVKADVLMGEDGLARAIRFVR